MADKLTLSEQVDTLFEGVEGVTDEAKTKMTTVLEAAVTALVAEERESIAEQVQTQVAEQVEAATAELEKTFSQYVTYAVNEWVDENRLAIESGIKLEQAENLMKGLTTLFSENNVNVPEDQVDVVESLEAKNAELTDKLNASVNESIELKAQVEAYDKGKIFDEIAEGLADTDKERFETLAEGVDFSDAETYKDKLQTIRGAFFKEGVQDDSQNPPAKLAEEAPTGEVKYSLRDL